MDLTDLNFVKLDHGCYVPADMKALFENAKLVNMDAFFSFSDGHRLDKPRLAAHRTRINFKLGDTEFFLKRFEHIPFLSQIKNWAMHRKIVSAAACELIPNLELQTSGINTPQLAAFGEEFSAIGERRSFIATIKIPDAQSLETKLPPCFMHNSNLRQRRDFIELLAVFTKRFHATSYRHRDFYLCHIFYSEPDKFYLIDLARCFKPLVFSERYRLKDLAQLLYSSPAGIITPSDRIRFYKSLTGISKLDCRDKKVIRKIIKKAMKMASHDRKHGRDVPFLDTKASGCSK